MIVKVCGITRTEQVIALNKLGVDMIGFNFYPKSQRYVSTVINDDESTFCKNVGVFVNPFEKDVNRATEYHSLDYIQLHGNESVELVKQLSNNHSIIKAFGIDDDFDFAQTEAYEKYVEYFLFDTRTPLHGGSGIKFNWQKLNEYQGDTGFLLSGGLVAEDALELQKMTHKKFKGVDINSGFEISPGIKDMNLIKQFLTVIKNEKSR